MKEKIRILSMALCIVITYSNIVYSMDTNDAIDREFYVKSDGAELYIKVRGQNTSNPVLLFLHGGPGEPTGPLFFQAYAGPELEQHFVVGYLHQRNTCKSLSAPVDTLTVGHYIKDVYNVVSFLKEKFKKDKIFLLGHSFGGILGYMYLLKYEDNIERFVSAGSAFSTIALEYNGYETVLELSKRTDNQQAIERLKSLGPPPYETFEEGMVWRMLYMNLSNSMNEGAVKNLQMSKVMSTTGIEKVDPKWMAKAISIGNAMWSELNTIELEDKVKNISTPILIITGAKDILVPFRLLKKGYEKYGGEKEYFILEESNHFMFIDEPDVFVSKVIEFFQK